MTDVNISQYNNLNYGKTDAQFRLIQTEKDPNRIPLAKKANWFQKESTARVAGRTFLTLGAIGLAGTVSCVATAAIGPALGVLAATVAFVSLGVILNKKDCWNDQNFVDKMSFKAFKMTFSELIQHFDNKKVKEGHLISKKLLTDKFLQEVKSGNLSYHEVLKKYEKPLNYNRVIEMSSLENIFYEEVKRNRYGIHQLKEIYGNQPIHDGVVSKHSKWYSDLMLTGLKNKNYIHIKQTFTAEITADLLSKKEIKNILMQQFQDVGTNIAEFMKQQGGQTDFWKIFNDKILNGDDFRNYLLAQYADTPVKDVVRASGWDLFKTKMALGEDFKCRFEKEHQDDALSTILQAYGGCREGWNVVAYGITDIKFVKPKALKEIETRDMSFDQIIDTFSWELFSQGELSGHDGDVRKRFEKFIRSIKFCALQETYGNAIGKYHLLDTETFHVFTDCSKRKTQAEIKYQKTCESLRQAYLKVEANAKTQRDEQLASSKKGIKQIEDSIRQAETDFSWATISTNSRLISLKSSLDTMRREVYPPIPQMATVQGHVVPGQRVNGGSLSPSDRALSLEREIMTLENNLLNDKLNHERNLTAMRNSLSLLEQSHTQLKIMTEKEYQMTVKEAKLVEEKELASAADNLKNEKLNIDSLFLQHQLSMIAAEED